MSSSSPCKLCTNLIESTETKSVELAAQADFEIFHTHCPKCSTLEEEPSLCPWCRHLRLRHLLFCQSKTSLDVCVGALDDVREVKDCKFHTLLQLAAHAYIKILKPQTIPTDSLKISLSVYKCAYSASGPAQIYLNIQNGDILDSFEAFHVYHSSHDQNDTQSVIPSVTHVPIPGLINWSRISGWVNRCCTEHDRCKPTFLGDLPDEFRVIDVRRRCIVQPGPTCQFVALSYVWGRYPNPSQLMAKRSQIQVLEQDGGLKASDMPNVIEEAMEVCLRLNEQYLWVDRLCIIQDDLASKQTQINSMAAIYARAIFTLAIACGDSMEVRLPGLRLKRDICTSQCQFDGIDIHNCLPGFKNTIASSAWATRGWTYQESVLSTKVLFITPMQVIFECNEGIVHEDNSLNEDSDIRIDLPLKFYGGRTALFSRGRTDIPYDYQEHSSSYNSRSLSHISDIYNAFAGVGSALYPGSDAFIHGLPLKDLDQALIWGLHGPEEHKPRSCETAVLPSWSWASVSGNLSYLSFYASLVKWTMISNDGATNEIKHIDGSTTNPHAWAMWHEISKHAHRQKWLKSAPQIYIALAASEGCFLNPLKLDTVRLLLERKFETIGMQLRNRWPEYTQYWRAVFESYGTLDTKAFIPKLKQSVLVTRAQVASVKLAVHRSHVDRDCGRSGSWFNITNVEGKNIGLLTPWVKLEDPHSGKDLKNKTFKILALSISGNSADIDCVFPHQTYDHPDGPHESGSEFIDDEELDITYRDSMGEFLNPVPVVNVMLIKQEHGFSRRVSVGWILLRRWAKLEWQFEHIFLA